MPTDQNPKQLVAERIKNASNILVTVNKNPNVDTLAAALALTLFLDKMDKITTAVVSGEIPPAIEFLDPDKTFDNNVDSLRDFIIALDKSKADRLRYKVEDDVVRVFITPYKTTLSEADLTFSQGDFNVDLVVALGVDAREDLDTAIVAHGRILHDAATVTINQKTGQATLGEVDWSEPEASSLCEMLMSLTEALQPGTIDQPIATALLTGLVSATERFSNPKTSPKVMTMAAQLMAAGANQQLIADKLEAAEATVNLAPQPANGAQANAQPGGEMHVAHKEDEDKALTIAQLEERAHAEKAAAEVAAQPPAPEPVVPPLPELPQVPQVPDVPAPAETPATPEAPEEPVVEARSNSWRDMDMPAMGGTLNATTEEAAAEKRREQESNKNRVLLSHDNEMTVDAPAQQQPTPPLMNATAIAGDEPDTVDIFAEPNQGGDGISMPPSAPPYRAPTIQPLPPSASAPTTGLDFEETPLKNAPLEPPVQPFGLPPVPGNPVLNDLQAETERQGQPQGVDPASPFGLPPAPMSPSLNPVDDARAAVDAALGNQPFSPAGQPLSGLGAQPLGDIVHEQPAPSPYGSAQTMPPAPAPVPPSMPPLPDFSTLPPLPGEAPQQPMQPAVPHFGLPEQPLAQPAPVDPGPSDPAAFRLPGQ